MSRRMVMTATGDALIERRLPDYPDVPFRRMVELIRSADVAFTNLEVVLSNYRGSPIVETGVNLSAEPGVARDLQRLGFNLTSFANNHTLNYGEQAVLMTLQALEDLEFVHAGVGRNLAEARAPAYLETPAGRAGLVACCSTFAPGQRAGEQRPDVAGRPGLNPLRFDTVYVVDREHMEAIRRVAERTGAEALRQRRVWLGFARPPQREGEFIFADRSFVVGERFGIRMEAHQGDLDANVRAVRQAAQMSDLTLVSIHAHEEVGERWEVPEFHAAFARACIDAGADAVLGHGPHLLRGLEIYKGKPIFYSLGNFVFQTDFLRRLPADDYERFGADPSLSPAEVMKHMSGNETRGFPADRLYWESVLPVCAYEDRTMREIRLYPLTLGYGGPVADRGTPRLADGRLAAEILEWMGKISAPFGTRVHVRDGVGYVQL